jgi:hypothetical protein
MHTAESSKTGQPPGIALIFGAFFAFRKAGISSNFEDRGIWPLRHPELKKTSYFQTTYKTNISGGGTKFVCFVWKSPTAAEQ